MCEVLLNSLNLLIDSSSTELLGIIYLLIILFKAAILKFFFIVPYTYLLISSASLRAY